MLACPEGAISANQLQICKTAKVTVILLPAPLANKDNGERLYPETWIDAHWLSFTDDCRVHPEKIISEVLAFHQLYHTSPIHDLHKAWALAGGLTSPSESANAIYHEALRSLPNQDDVQAYMQAVATIGKFQLGPSYILSQRGKSFGSCIETDFETRDFKRLSSLIYQTIAYYRSSGKDERWIQKRIEEHLSYTGLMDLLMTNANEPLSEADYLTVTDDIYVGLWQRTTAELQCELDLPKNVSLRDNQPTLALTYQGLAEEVSAQRLGDKTELTCEEARKIVRAVATLIGTQAKATSAFFGVDIATGNPLLAGNSGSK